MSSPPAIKAMRITEAAAYQYFLTNWIVFAALEWMSLTSSWASRQIAEGAGFQPNAVPAPLNRAL